MSVPTRYQWVGAAVNGTSTSVGNPDYDTVGFPPYLIYDGGDWFQTNSIDFSTGATNPPTTGDELVTNGDFSSSTGWSLGAGWTISGGTLNWSGSYNTTFFTAVTAAFVAGRYYEVTLTVSGNTSGNVIVYLNVPNNGILNGVNISGNGEKTFLLLAGVTCNGFHFVGNSATGTMSIDNISVKEINQLYAPDKMSVFAGVRQLNNNGYGGIVGLGTTINDAGSMLVWLRSSAGGGNIDAYSRGTTSATTGNVTTVDALVPPETFILTTLFDIGQTSVTDEMVLRMNGLVEACTGSGSAGTGTFGNAALNIGQYNSSNFFNGRDYGFVIVGRAVTASELTNTEDYMDVQTFGKNMALVYSDELTTALGELITAADGDQIYMSVSYV